MRIPRLSTLAVMLALLLPVNAAAYETVDAFVAAVQEGAAAGGENYRGLIKALDPDDRQPQMAQIGEGLSQAFNGEPMQFDVLFRVQNTDSGARLVGVLWHEFQYIYIAVLLHKRPDDGWLPVTTSFHTQFEKVLPYL